MTNLFSETTRWVLPETVLPDSLMEMASDGRHGNEGIVLWLGRDYGAMAEITYLVKLRGPLITKLPDHIRIESALFNDIADTAIEYGVRVVGQIHSHGPGYSVDLSPTDRVYGLQTPYYLSLVAPDYALSDSTIIDCGVHVFRPRIGYVRLSDVEVSQRIEIIPGLHLPFIEIGGSDESQLGF
jgi:hypothetical protein